MVPGKGQAKKERPLSLPEGVAKVIGWGSVPLLRDEM
jgi:hypothetical protein